MFWNVFLPDAMTALAFAFGSVYTAAFFLRRVRRWPRPVAYTWGFAVPLSLFLFVLILRSQKSGREWLAEYGLEPWAQITVILSALWFLLSAIKVGRRYLWAVFDISVEDNLGNRMRQTQLQFIEKMLIILLVILAFASCLLSFDVARQLGTSLLASAGIASLVIGFAGQKIVANLLAGFQIAFSQPLRIDDAVVIENEWGWVEEITLTYVVVRLWDLRRLIVPLSRLLDQPFQNWTRKDSKIIGSVFIKCAYSVDVDEVRTELDRILAETPLWDKDVKVVQVVESHIHMMEIRILISARTSSRAWDLRCYIRENLIKFLAAKGQVGLTQVSLEPSVPSVNH